MRDPLSPEQRAKFSRGTEVGIYARDLFPEGVDASPPTHFQMAKSVEMTAALLQDPDVKVIYEAAFEFDEVVVALDILYKENGEWKALEVKSSRSISDTYRWDASLQYYVITGSGLQLGDFSIAYINENYVKEGIISPRQLFVTESLFDLVKERYSETAAKVAELKGVTILKSSPAVPIGPHCNYPYPCEFHGHCWKKVPIDSVLQLDKVEDQQKFNWYHGGIVRIGDLPDEVIERELLAQQIESIAKGSPVVDRKALAAFLQEANRQLVLSVFDLAPAIPLLDGTSPYQAIPWGLRLTTTDGIPIVTYLDDPGGYSLGQFQKQLMQIADLDDEIWIFHKQKLLALLESCSKLNPGFKELIFKFQPRLKELLFPLESNMVVWPGMTATVTPENILRHFGKNTEKLPSKMAINEEAAAVFEKLMRLQVFSKENNEAELLENFMVAKHANTVGLLYLWKQLGGLIF
ncbi:MAG: hypothetical protein ACOCXV_03075 [Bacteroidota bacterium]